MKRGARRFGPALDDIAVAQRLGDDVATESHVEASVAAFREAYDESVAAMRPSWTRLRSRVPGVRAYGTAATPAIS